MKHPGHTYGGFISAISERGMTQDYLRTGMRDLDHPVLASAKNTNNTLVVVALQRFLILPHVGQCCLALLFQ
jgi:hypothetical protein